jgi:hypothetical protein
VPSRPVRIHARKSAPPPTPIDIAFLSPAFVEKAAPGRITFPFPYANAAHLSWEDGAPGGVPRSQIRVARI